MNKTIKVIRMGTPEQTRASIKHIVDNLYRNNYVISEDLNALKLFSRMIPNVYKRNGTIIIKSPIIALKENYKIEKINDFSFKIRLK